MEHRPGSKPANGHSSSGSGAGITRGQTQPSSDIYKQLINNDMVKELDDIEAISQQIFQHAEVLHNSWKNNGMTQPRPGQFKLSTAQQGPSLDHSVSSPSPSPSPLSLSLHNRERGGGGFLQSNGGSGGSGSVGNTGSLKQPSHYTRQAGYSDTPNSDSWSSYNNYHSLPDRGHKAHPAQLADSAPSPRHSQSSSVSSPTSSTRESPARGSSLTHITSDVGPLELLASPNLNGNLEDLVSSFVNTDRQKQAARNTISSTLMRRLGSPNGSASPVRSPSPTLGQQPTSPTSSLNYSPLRSPMLASTAQARHSEPLSPTANMFPSENSNDVHTPMQSIFSKSQSSSNNLKSSPAHHNNSHSHTLPKMSPNVSDIHTPMQSFFSHGPKASPNSNYNTYNNGANPKTSPLHINTDRDMDRSDGAIPIPVKHIPINKAPLSSDSPSSGGLKSPSVLQSAKQSSVHPLASGQGPSDQHTPMPNLFNEFGTVSDAKFVEMRRRFDEAKQRMALSLPAREGGVRPNSFGSMRMFDSPWGDDPSSFLLEQFRRRNKRMMPQVPHSELTPEQKQHISDRSVPLGPGMRRMMGSRPGGSVAERVLMFEKSPSAFGVEPVQVRVPQRREPQLSGTVITPWRASLHQEMAAPVSRQAQVSHLIITHLITIIDAENNHLCCATQSNFYLVMIFKLILFNVLIIFDN